MSTPTPPPFPDLTRRPSLANSIEVTVEVTTTSTYTPATPADLPPSYPPTTPSASSPPAYAFPPTSTPLSFFPSPSSSPTPESPPEYRSVPRTLAETYFLWGILCPFLWVLGARKLCFPEPVIGVGKHAAFVGGFDFTDREVDEESVVRGLGGPNEWTSGNPEESKALWREEEVLWAKRCVWCATGFVVVGGMMLGVGFASGLFGGK